MTSTLNQPVNEQGLYQPAHQPLLGKDNISQKCEFDSPNTLAKQSQFGQQQQWAAQQQQGSSIPQTRGSSSGRRQINLRTRDWNNQPWSLGGQGQQGQLGGDTYCPPAALINGSFPGSSNWQGDQSILQQYQQQHSSGLPTSNYQPSSTIPLNHNYQLPHSQLANSSIPQQQDIPSAQLNKNYVGGNTLGNNSLNANNFNNQSTIGNNQYGQSNIGNNQFGGIPNAPAFTGFRRNYRRQGRQMRPLRTRNWGARTENGWSGFNNSNILQENFLKNRQSFAPQSFAPDAPRMFSGFGGRQRNWQRGPYRQRNLRTRHWGIRDENGWANFNRGMYSHEQALPFMNRNRNLNWADEQGLNNNLNQGYNQGQGYNNLNQGYNQGQGYNNLNQGYNQGQGYNNSYIPTQQQGVAPVAALAPLTNNKRQGKRASRRQARKQAKQNAIAQQLNTQLNPPIGDPAVNHYRRGAPAAVPITGAAPGGLAAPNGGKFSSRRRGRRNNLGRRRGRNAQNALPVPATQPPFVAPVATAAPVSGAYPAATYRTVYGNNGVAPSSFVNQPSTAFRPVSNAGTFSNAQTGSISNAQAGNNLYSTGALQSRPLSNTLGNSSGATSNLPLYSAHEPVAAQILDKRAQAPTTSTRPIGSATF